MATNLPLPTFAAPRMALFPLLALAIVCGGSTTRAGAQAATVTTLAVTAGGSAVTTVAKGKVVTLTATVKVGSTPVTSGLVNFCVVATATCTDIHLLGSARLNSSGTAALKLRPANGTHFWRAVFNGTDNFKASSSGPRTLEVTGPFPTNTAIAVTGTQGNYTLTATVTGSASQAPSGEVSFSETSDGNTVLATAPLIARPAGINFALSQTVPPNGAENLVHVADFNGDGIPDIAALNAEGNYNNVAILSGKGDGKFTQSTISGISELSDMAVGDFNGDGIPDLLLESVNCGMEGVCNTKTATLLGNGDGTFGVGGTMNLPGRLSFEGVGDFNRDGIEDIAVLYQADTNTDSPSPQLLEPS